MFWRAVAVPPDSIRARGAALLAALAAGKRGTLTAANGTDISFGVTAARGFVSDGALTAAKVRQGGYAAETWLPAGELLVPVALGSAEGRVVVDRHVFQGTMLSGLALTFAKGKLKDMSATSGMDALRAQAGDLARVTLDNPARVQFDALHVWSTRLEGAVLLLGLVVTYLTAGVFSRR